jgi:hypothetical protein
MVICTSTIDDSFIGSSEGVNACWLSCDIVLSTFPRDVGTIRAPVMQKGANLTLTTRGDRDNELDKDDRGLGPYLFEQKN